MNTRASSIVYNAKKSLIFLINFLDLSIAKCGDMLYNVKRNDICRSAPSFNFAWFKRAGDVVESESLATHYNLYIL